MATRTSKKTRRAGASPEGLRLGRLRKLLKHRGYEALLITNANDIRYLTGFSGEASAVFVTAREMIVVSDFRFQEELAEIGRTAEIVIRSGPMMAEQIRITKKLKPKTLAVQAEYLSIEARNELAKGVGERRLRDASGLLAALRMVKDESELAFIRKAVKIQQEALVATLETVKAGQSEEAVCARLEYEARLRGASAMSFETIVAAKANGSKPHYRPGKEKLAMGRPLLIDWGVRFGGYCSDMTRTFCLAKWPKAMREIYEVVLEAHLAGIAAVKPGRTCAEVDAAARGVIERAGYGKQFGHGLGHGIGLDIHEAPRLFKGVSTMLEPGMVVTIEPGVYLPGVGGVRIEDDILVTDRGATNLCSLPKDIQWATLHG